MSAKPTTSAQSKEAHNGSCDRKRPDDNDKPTIPRLFEAAWANAFPGGEAAERNAVLRELSQLQQ